MKMLKKVLALLMAMLLLVLTLPVSTVFATDVDMRYGRKQLGEMSNSADLQYVYDKLVVGCGEARAQIEIDISGCNIDINSDLGFVYKMLYSDYPEYFWVNGEWNASIMQSGATVTLTVMPTYTMTGSALSAARSAYDAKVATLTAGLSGSDYDKAKTLHDRLIDTVTYTSTSNDQNAYGALVEGKAVCNGYARAYQHLMLKAGIPAWYVSGTSINPATGTPIGHVWNLVKLGGQWYYTDVTWDDQGANTFYSYFNITTQQLLEGHTIDATYADLVPGATATAENYYVKEGRVFGSYDRSKLVALLREDDNKTQIYVTGDLNGFTDALGADLIALGAELGATGSYQVSYSLAKLGHAVILEVIVTQENHTHRAKTTVPQVGASCLSNGTKAYYICDCGMKFLDQGCTQQITSDSQLEIKASEHSPSGWRNDAANHWKECIRCGSEIANTRGSHSDSDQDHTCNTCSYALPVPATEPPGGQTGDDGTDAPPPAQDSDEQGGGQTDSGNVEDEKPDTDNIPETNNPPDTDNTPETNNPPDTDNTPETDNPPDTDDIPDIDSTQGADDQQTTEPSSTCAATEGTTPPEKADPQKDPKPDNSTWTWVLIGGAVVAVAGAGTVVVLVRKKKTR